MSVFNNNSGELSANHKLAIQFSDGILTRNTQHDDIIGINVSNIDPITPNRHHNELSSNNKLNKNPPTVLNTSRRLTTNYPMTTVRSMPWLQTPALTNRSKQRNLKPENVVLYQKFEEYVDNMKDPFWADIFKQCSYGKFPRGITYRNNVLSIKKGTKIISEELSNDVNTGIDQCLEFFKEHGCLRSDLDIKNEKEQISHCGINNKRLSELNWKSIKNKSMRNKLITEYICKISKERNLNKKQKLDLKTMINLGFILKLFSPDHVIFEHGNIIEIRGLKWDYNQAQFYLDQSLTDSSVTTKLKDYIHQKDYLDCDYKFIINESKKINYIAALQRALKPLCKRI